ncbi:MAG: phospholipase D-like domain-containing protein [Syntrophales bacterium]|nr:phospholipase D-like domain-containing protein [Syntrophales bacterium]
MQGRLTKASYQIVLIFFLSLAILLSLPERISLSVAAGQGAARGKEVAPSSRQGCSVTLLKNGEYLPALLAAIDNAQKEILMSFFLFKTNGHPGSSPEVIMKHLIRATNRGIRVEVVLERGENSSDIDTQNQDTMVKLKKGGVTVYPDSPQRTTHTKLVVIDRRYTFVGSHNLTHSALNYNQEASVLVDAAQVAEEAASYISALYPKTAQ